MCPLEGRVHSVSSLCSPLSFIALYSLRVGIRGERRESEVDNRCHHTRAPLRITRVRYPARLQQPPQNIFISIIKQFFYMLIHQSELRLICGCGLPPSFRCAWFPGRHLSRCIWSTKLLPCQHWLIRGRLRRRNAASPINDALHLRLKRIFISFNNTLNSLEIMTAALLTAPAALFFFVMCI